MHSSTLFLVQLGRMQRNELVYRNSKEEGMDISLMDSIHVPFNVHSLVEGKNYETLQRSYIIKGGEVGISFQQSLHLLRSIVLVLSLAPSIPSLLGNLCHQSMRGPIFILHLLFDLFLVLLHNQPQGFYIFSLIN